MSYYNIGDTVTAIKGKYDSYSSVWNHISNAYEASRNPQDYKLTIFDVRVMNTYDYHPDGSYGPREQIKFAHSSSWYSANNFTLYERANNVSKILTIENDRPTLVREIRETTEDGTVKIETVGEYKEFKNLSAAQIWCKEQITNSIRETNTYRKFRIYQEKSVAQAKQPEIEFA